MKRTNLLQKLNKALSTEKVDFSGVDKELNDLKAKLTQTVNIQTLDDVNKKLKQLQKSIDFTPLMGEIDKIRGVFDSRTKELESAISEKLNEQSKSNEEGNRVRYFELEQELKTLEGSLKKLNESRVTDLASLTKQLSTAQTEAQDMEGRLNKSINDSLDNLVSKKDSEKTLREVQDLVEGVRKNLLERISHLGGGSKPLQINVNSSVMSNRYTDINFVSNTAIKWVATDDNTNKRVNIVASLIQGGSGGGGGTPSAPDQSVQFNNAGSFGGSSYFYWDDVNHDLFIGKEGETHNIISPSATTPDTNGGNWGLTAGDGLGSGNGGRIEINAGNTDTTGDGGPISIAGGAGGTVSGNGGAINITPGGTTTGVAGEISLNGTTNANGALKLAGGTSDYLTLRAASVAGNWTITFPTSSGSNAQYLMTDGNGITQWASVVATGGSGISRATSIISVNTTAGTTGSTDYVYFANVGIKFTLPTAVNNKNLYTIKNVSGSSVLVSTTGVETIDGSATALLPVTNQSLDIVSDNTNWNVV